jgi:hypothetical protein
MHFRFKNTGMVHGIQEEEAISITHPGTRIDSDLRNNPQKLAQFPPYSRTRNPLREVPIVGVIHIQHQMRQPATTV